MSDTDPAVRTSPPGLVGSFLSLKDLAKLLIQKHSLHEGTYEVSFEMQLAVGSVGPAGAGEPLPGAAVGVRGVGLVRAAHQGPHTVDAAEVNPRIPAKAATRLRRKAS